MTRVALEVLSFATLAWTLEKSDVLSLRFYSKSGDKWGFVDQAVPNRPIHVTWPKRCWPHCRDEHHPSFERSQRVWEQRMNRFTDVKSMNLQGRRFQFRDFHGSFALDFETRKWQTLEEASDGRQRNSFKGLSEAADLLEADDGMLRTVLDVGANLGFNSIMVAARLPRSRVIAIEANPVLFRVLQWNIRANNVTENVWPLNIAISREGHGQCNPADGLFSDCVTMKVSKNHRFIQSEGACETTLQDTCFQVPAWALRNVARRLNLTKIHHLKLNCEGCEYHILSDPVVRQMKEQGHLGNISGELHHFHQFEPFERIPAEMVEPTMRIMCNEELVSDNSRICESASTKSS